MAKRARAGKARALLGASDAPAGAVGRLKEDCLAGKGLQAL